MKNKPLFYTATMARACAAQGYLEESAGIYRYLLQADPDNHRLKASLADLEPQLSSPEPAPSGEERPPDRLETLVRQWVGLLVERDLEKKFDGLRKKIKTMSRQPE